MDPVVAAFLVSKLSELLLSVAGSAVVAVVTELKKDSDARELADIELAINKTQEAKSLESLFDDEMVRAASTLNADQAAMTHLQGLLAADSIFVAKFREWSVDFAYNPDKADDKQDEILDIVRASAEKVNMRWDELTPVLKLLFRRVLFLVRKECGPYLDGFEHRAIMASLKHHEGLLVKIDDGVNRLLDHQVEPPSPRQLLTFSDFIFNTAQHPEPYGLVIRFGATPPFHPTLTPGRPPQLDPPTLVFTGYRDELASVLSHVLSGKTTVCVIRGLPAAGKSEFALELARCLSSRFPGGQLGCELRNGDNSPKDRQRSRADIMRLLLPSVSAYPDSYLSGRYHAELHDRQVIVLADNAANAEQVEDIRPPEGNLLIVTTCRTFSVGPCSVCLDKLDRNDSCNLLLRIDPDIGPYADRLAELCADLPKALRLAAGTFSARKKITSIDTYVNDLERTPDRVAFLDNHIADTDVVGRGTLAESFMNSCRHLTKEIFIRWASLASLELRFSVEEAAALWKLDRSTAEGQLNTWVRDNVLLRETGGTFRLHPLMRDFARSRLSDVASNMWFGDMSTSEVGT